MKIAFTGGGTGGHFYPLIAVAEEIVHLARENQLTDPEMYYIGPGRYDETALYKASLEYKYCPAGKLRKTRDIQSYIANFFSAFTMLGGVLRAIGILYSILPDVVFSKGGYASFPVLYAARLLRIPVVMHESDARFGRVNKWTTKFASHIAIAYPEVESELTPKQKKRTALVGVPIRREIRHNPLPDAHERLKLEEGVPTVVVLGGSTGSQFINDNILDALPLLLNNYQVFHQVGVNNIESVKKESKSFLTNLQLKHKYIPIDYLDEYAMRALYTVADIVITRAGSTTLFEIAEWGLPSIVIPIRKEVSHDQISNAYAFARMSGAIVLEESNLSPNLLVAQIESILKNKDLREKMGKDAASFKRENAATKLAELLIRILKSHEA